MYYYVSSMFHHSTLPEWRNWKPTLTMDSMMSIPAVQAAVKAKPVSKIHRCCHILRYMAMYMYTCIVYLEVGTRGVSFFLTPQSPDRPLHTVPCPPPPTPSPSTSSRTSSSVASSSSSQNTVNRVQKSPTSPFGVFSSTAGTSFVFFS